MHHFIQCLVALEHAVHKITQRAPVVSAACQAVLINEEHILLEASVQVRLQAQLPNYGVVVAVDVGVYSVHALENLADKSRE